MFEAKKVKEVFVDKYIKVDLWTQWFTKNKNWFVFEEINATSEEKDFINLFEKKKQELEKKYTDIYLLRSERHFAIYSFDDWNRFEPDFVLFMKEKETKKPLTYQVFIEPKWDNLLENDKWKQDFLLQIEDNYKFSEDKILKLDLEDYKIIWLPFYNKDLENEFEEVFNSKLIK